MRRLAVSALASATILLLALPSAAVASGHASRAPQGGFAGRAGAHGVRPITRQDVLAGSATRAQKTRLSKSSIERAGGIAITAGASFVPFGYGTSSLAVDLDGDGNQEAVLFVYSDHKYIEAVDQTGVLWRQQIPNRVYPEGAFVGDFAPGGGDEVLVTGVQYSGTDATVLGLFDAQGLQWSLQIPTYWLEMNGLVQADGDAESEIAYTQWDSSAIPSIHTIDGATGEAISTLSSTVAQKAKPLANDEAFVTDGAADAPDEAVFLTKAGGAGYYAETMSLADGTVIDRHPEPLVDAPDLTQGQDYTGDGRRDALVRTWTDTGMTIGVFDPSTFKVVWSKAIEPSEAVGLGDVNGDQGSDLCFVSQSWGEGDATHPETSSVGLRCLSGKDGAPLWTASYSATGTPYSFSSWSAIGDVNGDGTPDLAVETGSYHCTEDPDAEYYDCVDDSDQTVALSGGNGSSLWPSSATGSDFWSIAASDIDGSPGVDEFLPDYGTDDTIPAQAAFEIRNGLTLTRAWQGVVPTNGLPGYADGAVGADLNGDGTSETVVTATGYEVHCNANGKHCHYTDHAFAAGFGVGGALQWSYEL